MKKIIVFAISSIFFMGCNTSVNNVPVNPPVYNEPNIDQILKDKYSFERLDINRNNSLDFEEFFNISKNDWVLPSKRETEYKTFLEFDSNKNFSLELSEFNRYKSSIGINS